MMRVIFPFLQIPPSRTLALDRWRILANETTISILLIAFVAFVVTFALVRAHLRRPSNQRLGAYLILVLPTVAAGVIAGGVFEHRFANLFPGAPQDITSVAVTVGFWTAAPQLMIALGAAWATTSRRSVRATHAISGTDERAHVPDTVQEPAPLVSADNIRNR